MAREDAPGDHPHSPTPVVCRPRRAGGANVVNRRLLVPLPAMLALFFLVSSASATTIDPVVKETGLGLTERGYLLSLDDKVIYDFDFPAGMTIRPRIEVAPASSLRVQVTLEAGWGIVARPLRPRLYRCGAGYISTTDAMRPRPMRLMSTLATCLCFALT